MTFGLPAGETASARVPASPLPWMSSPMPQGPTFFQSPVVPFLGHGGGGGGAGGTICAVAWPETLPGDLATDALFALNQHWPLLSV